MKVSILSHLSIRALVTAPYLPCANFTANFSPLDGPAPCIDAVLTEKGQQTCAFHLCDIYNHGYFVQNTNATPGRTQQLDCLPGYSAAINWDLCWVQYGYKLSSGAEHHGGFKTKMPVVDPRGVTYYTKANALDGC